MASLDQATGFPHTKLLYLLRRHSAAVWRLSWAHPKFGALLASCSYDRTVMIHQEAGSGSWGTLHTSKAHKSSVNDVEFSPHEHGLQLASCSSDGTLFVLRREAEEWRSEEIRPSCSLGVNALSWAPFAHVGSVGSDRRAVQRLATAACDGKVRVYRKAAGSSAGAGEAADGASSGAGSGAGAGSWQLEWVLDHEKRSCMGGAGAGAAAGGDGAGEDAATLDALRGGALWVRDVAFCPSSGVPSNLVASCGDDGSVLVWQQDAPGKPWGVSVLRAGGEDAGGPAWGVSWSLAGGVLAVTSGDGEVSLWKKPVAGPWEQVTASGTPVGGTASGAAGAAGGVSAPMGS